MPAWPTPARAPLLLFPYRATTIRRCLPPCLRPAACGTFRFPSLHASSSDESPQSLLPRPLSLCRAPRVPSPPCRVLKSKKYPQSAWRTACPHRAPAAVCSCPPQPSTRQSPFPTSLRRSTRPAPTRAPPESCLQETGTVSTIRVLPVPRVPAVQDLPPHRTCS